MNKKRALSILMAAAMAAGTLVTSVPVYADDVEEITWMFWDDLEATEDLISKGYKEVIDRFNEEYDGKYHVTPITTNLEEYDGKLNALIAAGQTPDVYICNPGPNMTERSWQFLPTSQQPAFTITPRCSQMLA